MNMKLQILVPQYNESDKEIKPLLDSIAIQQNVDFKEVGVIICNDGSDTLLSREFLESLTTSLISQPNFVKFYQCFDTGI